MLTTQPKLVIAFVLALALVYGGYNFGRSLFGPNQGGDFSQVYMAASFILEGQPELMYDRGETFEKEGAKRGIQETMTNAYPPFAALLTIPFALMSYRWARYWLYFLSIAATGLAIYLLFANRPRKRRRVMFFVGIIAALLFFPNYYSLYAGQINAVLLLCFTSTLFFVRCKRPYLAGAILALASMTKLFPGLLMLHFLVKKQFRYVFTSILFLIVLVSLSLVWLGYNLHQHYLTAILPLEACPGLYLLPRNQGFNGVLTRLFVPNPLGCAVANLPQVVGIASLTLSLAALGATLVATRTPCPADSRRYEFEYALYLAVIPLVLCKSWESYAIFLLVPYLLLVEFIVYEAPGRLALAFLVSLSFCIRSFALTTTTDYLALPKHPAMNFVISAPFFSTLILFGCIAYVLANELRQSQSTEAATEVGRPKAVLEAI